MGKAFSLIDQSGRITVGCKPAANFGTFVPTIIPCLARFSEVYFIFEESSYLYLTNYLDVNISTTFARFLRQLIELEPQT